MYTKNLDELVSMCQKAGNRVDYVQSGGGNTSVKFEDGYMAIKASGYRIKDMTSSSGFVAIDAASIKKYHETEHDESLDLNKDSMEMAISSIKSINGEASARPSVELGFHSILKKFVLHLHPIYANVVLCAEDSESKLSEVLSESEIHYIFVPYVMPGYPLTKKIQEAMQDYEARNAALPQAIMMKNHGMITHADSAEEAFDLMEKINMLIKKKLNLPDMPDADIEEHGDFCASRNEWLLNALKDESLAKSCKFDAIYPDQLVYLCNDIGFDPNDESKILIHDGKLIYRSDLTQATALEETLSAALYVLKNIADLGWKTQTMTDENCSDILGWDSEKYRKSLLSNK